MASGTVFDIKRFATHDGPGIRTTVFFSGCPLSCWWCHNPESWQAEPRIIYHAGRCIGCRECITACPRQALRMTEQGVETGFSRCRHCGACVQACPADARQCSGRITDTAQVMAVIEKDTAFYDQSGGGVTFSGGEPMAQADFLMSLLEACGRQELHRAVDTCGHVHREVLGRIARHTDLFLYDIKTIDPQVHQKVTGVPNDRILDNLLWLSKSGARIILRIPIVPGVNDDDRSLRQMLSFLSDLPGRHPVCLLPYHTAARHKYLDLGFPFMLRDAAAPSRQTLAQILDCMKQAGIEAQIGG